MAANDVVTVGLVQMACSANPDENLAKACAKTREAAARGAQIVCHQELFRSPYFCQTEDHAQFDLAEPIPGPSTQALGDVARECGVTVVASLFEKRARGIYHNTAAMIGPGGELIGIYRKMHIPDDPAFYEKFYFTPGDTGFVAWDTKIGDAAQAAGAGVAIRGEGLEASPKSTHAVHPGTSPQPPASGPSSVRFGTLVCWDQWFPEGARLTAMQGAEVLFYPTAIGWHPAEREQYGSEQHGAWETIQRSHAIANGVYVCVINRIGHELPPQDPSGGRGVGIQFWGQSFVADPMGQVIAKASVDQEETLIVPLDLKKVEFARTHWPFLRDRRVDAYAGLASRFGR